MVLPQFLLPILLLGCAQGKPNGVEKKILAIVAMPLPKMKKKKKFVLAIVAMALPKMEKKKCYEICERVKKKKKLSRPQYFYNIFTINHTWLVIIN